MAMSMSAQGFLLTEVGMAFRDQLIEMVKSGDYYTDSTFSANLEQYPDSLIPFVDKHVRYMQLHPTTNPDQYLSNLRLMTRIKK
jgi:hypothetical protein